MSSCGQRADGEEIIVWNRDRDSQGGEQWDQREGIAARQLSY